VSRTYTYADALNFVRTQVPATTEDQKAATICNIGTNLIWNAFDWRETIEVLPPFWLTSWTQDYGAPLVVVPSDFLGLRTAQLTDISSVPPAKYPLKVLKFLEPTHMKALPHAISYEPSVNSFRLFPRVPSGIGPARFKIDGTYKKRPTLVTAANYTSTNLPFDDLYFQVWLEVLRWAAMSATGNERAGAAVKNPNGGVHYSGQLGTAMAMINAMADNEGFNLGDTTVAPSEGLSSGGSVWNGPHFLFG
jgi:hypothetical protein